MRALTSQQCGLGSIPMQTWRHMWVEFVGSLLCTDRFSAGTPAFPSIWFDLHQFLDFSLQCPHLVLQR